MKPNEEFPYGGGSIRNQKSLYKRFDESSSYKNYSKKTSLRGDNKLNMNLNIKQNFNNDNERIRKQNIKTNLSLSPSNGRN